MPVNKFGTCRDYANESVQVAASDPVGGPHRGVAGAYAERGIFIETDSIDGLVEAQDVDCTGLGLILERIGGDDE